MPRPSMSILTQGVPHAECVAWHPDGHLVAGTDVGDVLVVPVDGSAPRVAARTERGYLGGIAIDGRGLAYVCHVDKRVVLRIDLTSGAIQTYSSGSRTDRSSSRTTRSSIWRAACMSRTPEPSAKEMARSRSSSRAGGRGCRRTKRSSFRTAWPSTRAGGTCMRWRARRPRSADSRSTTMAPWAPRSMCSGCPVMSRMGWRSPQMHACS